MTAKAGLLTFNCADCNKTYLKKFDENLSNRFENTYQFCDKEINKFCLILRKGVYPYEHIDGWGRFIVTLLLTEEKFCSNLTM